MGISQALSINQPVHPWLRPINVAYVPGPVTALLEEVVSNLLEHFSRDGHQVQEEPDDSTDVLLTTAPTGQPLNWRQSLLFTARRRFKLHHTPTLITLMQATPAWLQSQLEHFERALSKPQPDPQDFAFEGMAPDAYQTLIEQGQRGGPILALERVLQAQSKSIRVVLVVGEQRPLYAHHFDLVGAYPRSEADPAEGFYEDIVRRIATVASTHEITDHQVLDEIVPASLWKTLSTPQAMRTAGQELGKRNFFTEMVLIERLVHVPAVSDAVASQYSEGCFATWDTRLGALIATVTGSSRPVDKTNVTEDDLAVIVNARPDGQGAVVRHIEKHRNDPPSSEAVEMIDMDSLLPRIKLGTGWDVQANVPVTRSKLHGHRGILAYDPRLVEFVPLDPPYYHYPVSCATEAQARGIKAAFSRSQTLLDPDDPRQMAFTVLPGHGAVIAEKWATGKAPFQLIWEAMDNGALEISKGIPQGPMRYTSAPDGRLVLGVEEQTE
jgi:hypothetical protein